MSGSLAGDPGGEAAAGTAGSLPEPAPTWDGEADAPLGNPARRRLSGKTVLGVVLCLAPMAAVALSPLSADTALVYIGLLPAVVSLTLGARVAAATGVATAAVVFVGLLSSESAVVGALLMALLGLGVAWARTHGWQVAATYVATQAALATVAAPQSGLLGSNDNSTSSPANAAVVALIVLAAGLWVAGIGHALLTAILGSSHARPWDRDLRIFAVTLSLLLGIATFAIMRWTDGGNAWWILLTILVSLTPTASDTVTRVLQRAGGTVLGGAVAAVLVLFISDNRVLTALGVAAAIGSVAAFLKAPYWQFAAALTLALVLLTFPVGQVLRTDLERVGYTVLAAMIVLAVTAGVNRLSALAHTRAL